MPFTSKIRGFCISCQQELFPQVVQQYGRLPKRYQMLLYVFEMIGVEDFFSRPALRARGRPLAHRASLARSFIAKMVLNIQTTSALRERLLSDQTLRSLCGWSRPRDVPSESTFSRAFKEFSEAELPTQIHASLIENGYQEQLVGHISRDSTAIEARLVSKKKKSDSVKRKRGRPKGRTSQGGQTTGTPAYHELGGDGR